MGMRFRHEVIDPDPPGSHHDITLVADLTGCGLGDIIIGGKEGDVNLFWYENPGWRHHEMASAPQLEAGGVVIDLNRDGRPDVVAGQQIGGNELYWFECPADPRERWTRHVIEDRFEKYHDQALGDIDADGEQEIIFASQKSAVIGYYDIPPDPTAEPWPRECCHILAEGVPDVEGLVVADLFGEGPVLVAGPSLIRPGREAETFAPGWVKTRAAVADLDGDGRLEIVLCEGESHPGRLAVCRLPELEPRVLRDDLFHPHSLAVADFDGDGRPDIFVAEMGLGRNDDPRMFVYRNLGGGEFEEVLICRGVPTHEAKAADLTGDGRPDIVGKPYDPERHVDVWFNEAG